MNEYIQNKTDELQNELFKMPRGNNFNETLNIQRSILEKYIAETCSKGKEESNLYLSTKIKMLELELEKFKNK